MYRTYQLKIKNTNKEYFNRLFAEAKWYYNTILASEDVFKFDTKLKTVQIKIDEELINKETLFLSSQMRQGLKKRAISNILGLHVSKTKNRKVGKLKFKSAVNSIPLTNQTFKISGKNLSIQGLKKSKFKIAGLDQLPKHSVIKSANLIKFSNKVYLNITVEQTVDIENKDKQNILGLDFGIKNSLTFSDSTILNIVFKDSEQLIRKAHKKLSRKKKGSKNRNKAKQTLSKAYKRLDNQKKDVCNKILNKLNNYKVYFQDEMLKNWQKGLFGKKMQRGILGRIKTGLRSNPNHVMIPREKPTTKFCPSCGVLNKIELKERIYKCVCGYEKPRDVHSAQNMILFGTGRADVEIETSVYEELSSIVSKFLSVKQEVCSFNYK